MEIRDGILASGIYDPARWIGGTITPEIVVLHDTASSLEEGNAAEYLRDNEAKVSVHFVIERSGAWVQQVPVNRRANHAGKSHYHGRDWCNGFALGIELVNPGLMRAQGSDFARTWYGSTYSRASYHIEEAETEAHGRGLWMNYTSEQVDTLLMLLQALFAGVPTLRDVTTHWYVSPGRKVDTNPLLPLDHIRARVLGRDDPADAVLDEQAMPPGRDQFVQVNVPGGTLNMRRWPSFNPNVLAQIPDETILPVVRTGVFGGRKWLSVFYGGQEGWIVASYADPITFQETAS